MADRIITYREALKEALRDNQIPEVSLPPYLQGLSLAEKIDAARSRYQQQSAEVSAIERELQQEAENWRPLYERIHQWLGEQLTLLKITAQAYATDNCFVLFGWMKSGDVAGLQDSLSKQYGGTVVVEVREILEHDLETVPVTLRNAPYFQPFELLVDVEHAGLHELPPQPVVQHLQDAVDVPRPQGLGQRAGDLEARPPPLLVYEEEVGPHLRGEG